MKTMHEHDIDRIAAVAEHRLSGRDLAAAQAQIDACEECSRNLEAQRIAIAFLQQAPPVTLTSIERARLHRAMSPAPARSRWVKLAPVFAAAAALVVVASVLLPRGGTTEAFLTGKSMENSQAFDSAGGARAPVAVSSTTAAPATTTLPTSDAMLSSPYPLFARRADELRDNPPAEPTTLCQDEARDRLGEDPITASEIDYNGTPAVMYVYPKTALIFEQKTCVFLEEIPADNP
ncbi:MAG: hypothetical protein WAM81_01025 [Acidimicrobiia bacterium]